MRETAFQRYCSVSYPDTRMILQLILCMLFHILLLSFQTCFKKITQILLYFFFYLFCNMFALLYLPMTALFSRITCGLLS